MRLVFAGTPAFAQRALAALAGAAHQIALVVTQPDRPAGRGMQATQSAVKREAEARAIEVFQPATLRDGASLERLRAARPEALVVAAYGLILPQAALDIAPHGALNIHASMLPRWRGAAPIQRALLAGDAETGVTIMRMDAGLDTGPILAQQRIAIGADADCGTLHDALAELAARLIVDTLAEVAAGRAAARPQPAEGISYARKIEKRETLVDWTKPAAEIERALRAFHPVPGARSTLRGEAVKLWRARHAAGTGAPGEVLAAGAGGVFVACGAGALAITELQRPGGKRLGAAEFLHGCPLAAGERFGA